MIITTVALPLTVAAVPARCQQQRRERDLVVGRR